MKRIPIILLIGLGIPAVLVAGFFGVREYKKRADLQNDCLASAHYDTARKAWVWQENRSGIVGIYRDENGQLRSGTQREGRFFSTRDEAIENCIAANK